MSSKIIKGTFGPKNSTGNPNPGDPKQPSPPTFRENAPVPGPDPVVEDIGRPGVRVDPNEIPEQVLKAMGIIQAGADGGMAFVVIGIKPAPTGGDFYTAIYGDHGDLRNALDHLPGVIERAYTRHGITQ